MKKSIISPALFASAAAAAIALLLNPASVSSQSTAEAEIEAAKNQYRQAWQRGDLDGVMRFWTPDAKSIGSGGVASGAAAIRASLEVSLKMGIWDLRDAEREVYGSGNSIVEVTRSIAYDRAGKPVLTVRYMTLWQKSGGQWRILREFVIPVGAPAQP